MPLTQLFCSQEYHGYYLRGQTEEFLDYIHSDNFPENYAHAYYVLTFFVLIRNTYAKQYNKEIGYADSLGYFEGKTAIEFIKIREKHLRNFIKDKNLLKDQSEKRELDPFVEEINIKDINIVESPYLLRSIKNKADIIFLRMNVALDRIELPSNDSIVEFPKHIYQLPAYHLSKASPHHEGEISEQIDWTPGIFSDKFSFNLADTENYSTKLCDIGDIAWEWIEKKSLSERSVKLLNTLYGELKDKADPYKEYYFSFLHDLTSDLKDHKFVGQCSYCENFFKYASTKKFCSLLADGKNCGKSVRNKRHYIKNKEKILPKVRDSNRKLKAFYKEKGIIK